MYRSYLGNVHCSQTRLCSSINDLTADARGRFLVNYEILGNSDPVLHAHVTPRYASEPEERRKSPAWFYDFPAATHFDPDKHGALQARIARALTELGLLVGNTQHVV